MGSASNEDLQTVVISSALIFTAVVFGVAVICAFVPLHVLLKSRFSRRLGRLVQGLLAKRKTQGISKRNGKVAPELNPEDGATEKVAKKEARKRKKRVEELSLASYTPGMAWCVDRALDVEGSSMYEQGLRIYVEPDARDGEQADEDAPFVDVGRVIGAEAVEAFPGVIRLRREGKGNVAVEMCNFDASMLGKAGIGSEPLWRDLNEKEWELCGALGVFNREMFGGPEPFNPERNVIRQGFHPELLEMLQLLTEACVIAINGTIDEDVKMNCQDDFWVVDRLMNVAGRPVMHKGVHMYLEDQGDPDDPDDDEMRCVGRVVGASEARSRTGVIKIITADPAGELAVQSRKFRGSAIDPRGLASEPLWATMAPRWLDQGNKGQRGKRSGAGLQPLPRVTANELANVLTRTLAVDRQLASGAVDAEEWRKARGNDPSVQDVEAAVEEALDWLLYKRGKPDGYEAALERAREAEEAAARRTTTELRIVIKEKVDGGGGEGDGGGAGQVGHEGIHEEEAPSAVVTRQAAAGRGAVSVDDAGAASGEVRIDINMGDRDTVYMHLDAEVLSRLHAKRD